jgi:predicted phage tail protein
VIINAGTATQICITQNPNCSGGAAITVAKNANVSLTAFLADAFNNSITVSSATQLSVVNTGNGSVSPSTVTIAANQATSGTFTWAAPTGANKAGTVTVTAGSLSGSINLTT